MESKSRKILLKVVILVIATCLAGVGWAAPMGTAFTYQGRLMDANSPAEGAYDFEFEVYDAVDGGSKQGSTVDVNDLDVIEGYFAVPLDFGSSVFDGDARWLEIAVRPGESTEPNDFTTLSPRQELTPTPYAMQTRGIFVDDALNVGIGTQSLVGKLHVDGGKAMEGTWGADLVFKAQDGGDGWAMQYDGAPGGDIILLPGEGGEEIESGSPGPDGNVGIGTMSPKARLSAGGDGYINTGVYGNASNYGVYGYASNYGVFGNSSNYGVYGMGSYSGVQGEDDDSGSFGRLGHDTYGVYGSGTVYGGYFLGKGYFSGDVGIGTTSPAYPLHVAKTNANNWIAGFHNEGTGAQDYGVVVRADGGDPLLVQTGSLDALNVKQDGNIGIGTTSPVTKLHINGGSDASLGGGGFLVTGSVSGTNMVLDTNEIIARNNGSPAKLYLNNDSGNVVVSVLEITGGSDLAEPFEVAGAESIEPGMVVAIDPEQAGKLVVSSEAYDRKVAGIISGAGGIKPGMLMGQKGSVANGANPVALTGRVYCLADAAYGPIQPGDLLTTSQTPGHAMKVTDHSRAHGAILGKAMSSLNQGQGLVLVLVTLQ